MRTIPLGKCLMTCVDGQITGGIIIKTEAYRAPEDRASHAYAGRRTARNETMHGIGGTAYFYRCYGIHTLFNIVTNKADMPHAILIRAIKPFEGLPIMLKRRNKIEADKSLCSGPGTLTQALGIGMRHNGLSLCGPEIWIEDRNIEVKEDQIMTLPRVGVDYAGEDALLPWRLVYLWRELQNFLSVLGLKNQSATNVSSSIFEAKTIPVNCYFKTDLRPILFSDSLENLSQSVIIS